MAKIENDNIRNIFQCKGGRFNLGGEQLTFSKDLTFFVSFPNFLPYEP